MFGVISEATREHDVEPAPRLKSVAGVARALIATVGVDDAVSILVSQFGWDVAFSALAQLDGPEATVGMWRSVEMLVCDEPSEDGHTR